MLDAYLIHGCTYIWIRHHLHQSNRFGYIGNEVSICSESHAKYPAIHFHGVGESDDGSSTSSGREKHTNHEIGSLVGQLAIPGWSDLSCHTAIPVLPLALYRAMG